MDSRFDMNRNTRLEEFRQDYKNWLASIFFFKVMNYLSGHRPDELDRDTFRLNCERIYNEDKDKYDKFVSLTYYNLFNDPKMQEILELWNDAFKSYWEEDDKDN